MVEEQTPDQRGKSIRRNLEAVRSRMAAAGRRSGRAPESVSLVAVTKKCPVELIRPLVDAGMLDLGENYPQELWRKAERAGGSC